MIQEKAIRCISVNSDKVRYIIPRLANDDNFLKEIGFMRQELDGEIYIDKEGNEVLNLGHLETVSDVLIKEFEAKENSELEPTQESKPKKAKRK